MSDLDDLLDQIRIAAAELHQISDDPESDRDAEDEAAHALEQLLHPDLPTFGGPEPDDTSGVWSWDETRLLVGSCIDDLRIVPRATSE